MEQLLIENTFLKGTILSFFDLIKILHQFLIILVALIIKKEQFKLP